ncbi:hypothetical protein SAMN03159341_104108 [Paenibacillus sp. 1_12]|uniref:hypothetical protein n=1 Tax=Paenibacillus sp. 1_12 TaxID=1566278 RepID=UPI0008E8DDB7|nr:hypothetical protein [Paenibacillus sp. 1_12]SFL22473.1 hypothetical protein SAMN03159341_104108 [Paenibacillus sp. 1_12]
MSIFYRDMNHERIGSRWLEWEGHRNEIKLLISHTLSDAKDLGRAIVLGAGNCDDVDLHFFCDGFSQLTLVDIDAESLQEAINRLAPDLSERIELLGNVDFTKLDQVDFYNRLTDLLEQKTASSELCSFLIHIPSEMLEYSILNEWEGQFSVVISSAVYTQIFFIHVLTLFAVHVSNYTSEEVSAILGELRVLRNYIVKAYNDLMITLAEEDGYIIAWSDVVKFDEMSPFPEEQFYSIHSEEERIQFVFDIAGKQGREAAVVGMQDLHEKLIDQNRQFACWIWPYSSNRHYITFGLAGRVRKAEV